MPLFDAVRALPLTVERCELEPLRQEGAPGRTAVHLYGGGDEGLGEDVTYEEQSLELALDAAGDWTVETFSAALPDLPGYRRWAFESAALDLALRQNGLALADAVDREPRPVTFVVSTRRDPREWLERYPALRFKLDARNGWTDEVVAALADTGAVDVVDLKGHYVGDWVDADPTPELYRRVAEAFRDAWLEDARLTAETEPVLAPHRDRLTWDAVVHGVDDVLALPFPPRCLNSKPSRFGTVERLFAFYDWCEENGVAIYGGGQFEVGPGRGQIQHLASLFHPEGPNDVAPSAYNAGLADGLPQSPLPPPAREPGFR